MGAKFEAGSSYVAQRMESGMKPARCVQVIELGTHKNTHPQAPKGSKKKEILITFEVSELMKPNEDGEALPFFASLRVTNSMGQRAKLRQHLENWRNAKFTEDEAKNFDVAKILDKECMLNIAKVEKQDGRVVNTIQTVNPLPQGLNAMERVNDLVNFGIEDATGPEYDKLPYWVRKIIADSIEGKELGLNPEKKEEGDQKSAEPAEDDVPF